MTDVGLPPVAPWRRFLALLVDAVVGGAIFFIPGFGGPLSLVWILTRDALPFAVTRSESLRNRSLGKRLLGIRLATDAGGGVTVRVSIRRNMPLVLGLLLAVAISPLFAMLDLGVGHALLAGPMALVVLLTGLVTVLGETIMAVRDDRGRRWGDRFAGTQVVEG